MNNLHTLSMNARTTDEILDLIYQNYFVNFHGHSEVTSSHWSSIGQQNVRKTGGRWDLAGIGFGNVIPPTPINRLKRLPQTMLLNQLLHQYSAPKRLVLLGREIARLTGRLFDFDCVKQVLSLNHILTHLPENAGKTPGVICVIGDGYGYLTSLIRLALPQTKVVCVNLGRTLLFDVYYTSLIGETSLNLITERREGENSAISFIEAENYDLLEEMAIDLFINIASMQEMNNIVIKRYFELMRSSRAAQKYFYCCNRRQKSLPSGEVTIFERYPWNINDKIFTDELCPWYQRYPASLPPFWRHFDGPTQHRLVELAAS